MPSRPPDDYVPVLLMFLFGVVFAVGSLGVSHLLGERGRKVRAKDTPYECGMPVQTHAHERFSVKFYLLAILFIVFDVEVVFMYPWASAWGRGPKNEDMGGATTALLAWELAIFVLILLAGWWYVVKKGVLEWHREE